MNYREKVCEECGEVTVWVDNNGWCRVCINECLLGWDEGDDDI